MLLYQFVLIIVAENQAVICIHNAQPAAQMLEERTDNFRLALLTFGTYVFQCWIPLTLLSTRFKFPLQGNRQLLQINNFIINSLG